MARRHVPIFPAMVIAIPIVIGMAAISTTRHAEMRLDDARDAAAQLTAGADGALLDGREKSFIVVGDATSYVWPAMLQDLLDEHAGGHRVYHVQNAVVGGAPVRRWIAEPGSAAYEQTFGAMRRDFLARGAPLRADAPLPTVALCQQTLQQIRGPKGPIRSMSDRDGIRIGADALQRLATRLHEAGAERVYMATHIYTEGYEPNVGNERLALRELLSRGLDFVHEGPDVWSITIGAHPRAYEDDRVHPNELGMKLVAEAWYRTIAGVHAKQALIDRMHARDYDVDALIRAHLRARSRQ